MKSLSPSDELAKTDAELKVLLQAGTAIVTAQIHKNTSDMVEKVNELQTAFSETDGKIGELKELMVSKAQGPLSLWCTSVPNFLGETKTLDQEIADLQSWLEPIQLSESDYYVYKRLRAHETCEWAFDASNEAGKRLLKWLRDEDKEYSLVRLTGAPGRGKSVLATWIIDRCKDEYKQCLFYFCIHNDERKRSADKMLRTLAFCLARIEDSVRNKYLSSIMQNLSLTGASCEFLWHILFEEMFSVGLSRTIHCVIDGYDELHEKDRTLLASLFCGVKRFKTSFRILLVGRPDRSVEEAFKQARISVPVITIDANYTKTDIRSVIIPRVNDKFSKFTNTEREEIVSLFAAKAEGVFLWAKIALEKIMGLRYPRKVFETIHNLPMGSDMNAMYLLIIDRIRALCESDDDRALVEALWRWIVCSVRPLSVFELEAALGVECQDINIHEIITDFGGSLIEIGDAGKEKQVTVIHFSVKEFFLSTEAGDFHVSKDKAHRYLSRVCLNYLQSKSGRLPELFYEKQVPIELETAPLLGYACQHWSSHLAESACEDTQQSSCDDISDIIKNFLHSAAMPTWISVCSDFDAKQSVYPSEWLLSIAKAGVDAQRWFITQGLQMGMMQ